MADIYSISELQQLFEKMDTLSRKLFGTYDYFPELSQTQKITENLSKIFSSNYDSLLQISTAKYFENLSSMLKSPLYDIESIIYPSWTTKTLTQAMSDCFTGIVGLSTDSLLTSYTSNIAQIFNGLAFEEDFVDLTEESLESLKTTLDSFTENNETDIPPVQIQKHMSLKEFLAIFLPLLFSLITIIQAAYYHKIDALESQKEQMIIQEYENQKLKLIEEQTAILEKINESLNELHEQSCTSQELPTSDSDTQVSANHFDKGQNTDSESADEACLSDKN